MAHEVESLLDAPRFLTIAGYRRGADTVEVVSRRKLDTRQVLPFFQRGGVLHAGVLERTRMSRVVRGVDARGLEAIGWDFAGVDQTGEILEYGRAIFSARTKVTVDERATKLPLPSQARSVGYLTELSLPLLLPIVPPLEDDHEVSWDGRTHHLRFRPVDALRTRLATERASEDLDILLQALSPERRAFADASDGSERLATLRDRVWSRARLAAAVRATIDETFARVAPLQPTSLRFLRLSRVIDEIGESIEVVTPSTGASLAIVPYVMARGVPHFLLWIELRPSVIERRLQQPIFDLPMSPRYVNATAAFLRGDELQLVDRDLRATTERVLARALERAVTVRAVEAIGGALETAPAVSSEVRRRVTCALDPDVLRDLPPDIAIVPAPDLVEAVRAGVVRDPVIVSALLAHGLDPFAPLRDRPTAARDAFLGRMSQGSIVQRRLESYSSIEREQLGSKTYARLMTLLQHEFGVRIAYPENEADRSFFKAAFRVFMADDRKDNRALQGLHWSHDAFHFALGNFTLKANDLRPWFVSGAPLPPALPEEGPVWDAYARALKSAEDEATFFSFWTLYDEQPSLARHVGKLTFHQMLVDMGIRDRATSRAIFDALTTRAELPREVEASRPYRDREEVRSLCAYMIGFRDYHFKDMKPAFQHASRDPYRGIFLRFGIYESDSDRYVASVKSFQARLDAQPSGLNPLLAASADARVSLALRVWDVVKALKLLRKATQGEAALASVLDESELLLQRLERHRGDLETARARIENAEMSLPNEETFAELQTIDTAIEQTRAAIWDWVEARGVIDRAVVDTERVRALPR